MKKLKWFLVLSLIAFVGTFLAACSSESSSNASNEPASEKEEKQPIEVNIGIQQSIWPILAAKENEGNRESNKMAK